MAVTVGYEVRQVRDKQEMEAALKLRHDVFCIEQGVPEHEEVDGRDPDGIHLVAVAGRRMIGTCRLLPIGRTIQFSRLAVQQTMRRRGVATALLEAAETEANNRGARRMVLHAQTYARALYEGMGYRARGAIFSEAGIEHVAMEKELH